MDDAKIIDAFQALNRERIERLGSLLPAKNRGLIEFLPLLFQINSESLPGYISDGTPAGIVDYKPTQKALDTAKKHHHAFTFRRTALSHYPIRAVYLINDQGLYNYTANEPLELWIIYSQPISEAQCTQLTQKAAAISAWAHEQKVPVEIKLFDEASLTDNPITSYDLDRLYCCGLLLAGCTPSWWTQTSDDYAKNNSHHFTKDTINFGTISTLAAQELFDIVATNINKAMEQGLESCLDLIYFNHLLENFSGLDWLSNALKTAIIDGEADPMLLDVNTLKLQVLTQKSSDIPSLALAQKSLYIRSKEFLSKNIQQALYPWRREFIKEQLEIWQWQDDEIESMDQTSRAQYRQSLPLFKLVRTQLADSLAILINFSKQHKLKESTRQRQLQQKFDLLFEKQADTLNHLPRAFFPQQAEEYAYLYRSKKTNDWYIDDQTAALSSSPLYQHHSLLNVLAWAINNHLISKSTRLKVADESHTIKTNVVLELVQHLLRSSINTKPKIVSIEQLDNPAEIQHMLLFANLDHQSSDALSQSGLEMSSLQADPLNYANKKQNLVASIEGLIHSSWDQWHYFIFTGDDSLLQMLSATILWSPSKYSSTTASCWCHYGHHGQNISDRIEKIYHRVLTHYIAHPDNGEYLVSLGDRLYQLHWQDSLCDVTRLTKKISLSQHLAKNRTVFYNTNVDSKLDENSLFSTILNHQSSDKISLFLLTEASQTTLFIIDDMGSLFKQKFHGLTEETLTNHLHSFLSDAIDTDSASLHFFRLEKQRKSGFNSTTIKLGSPTKKKNYLPVTIEMDSPDEGSQCTIRCGSKVFSGVANESALFLQVRDLLLSLRKTNNYYPLYITKLSFKQKNTATRDYLIQKQRLEYLLNKL